MSSIEKKNPRLYLRAYMEKYSLNAYRLALRCHVSASTINGALRDNRIGQNAAYKIEKFTKGEIKFSDLTDQPLSSSNKIRLKQRKEKSCAKK